MERTVTASHHMEYEDAVGKFWITAYSSDCGCSWTVDMWGNVTKVKVCSRCINERRLRDQLVFDLTRESAADG